MLPSYKHNSAQFDGDGAQRQYTSDVKLCAVVLKMDRVQLAQLSTHFTITLPYVKMWLYSFGS